MNTALVPDPASDSPMMTATGELRAAARTGFVLELARALHQYGTPSHRLEAALYTVATRLGLTAEFFSTPTSIMVGFGDLVDQRVHLLRVEPGEPNLGHLAQVSDIVRDVVDGTVSPADGLQRLHVLKAQPPRWPVWLVLLAFVLSSAAVACFLRVKVGDVAIASVLGLITGAIALGTSTSVTWRPVTEPVAAFVVTTLALALDVYARTGTGYATSLAGLIVLLPGLTLTVALTELSTRHLSSGTARLSGAIVVFLGLGFGLALGARLGGQIGLELRDVLGSDGAAWLSRAPLPRWTEWVALIVAPLAFTVLLNASARDAGWIVLACVGAYLTSRFVGASMGEVFAAFLGAFVVSAGSNVVERVFRRTSMVTAVPGLLILVPGSIGFRSMTSLVGDQYDVGVATAFRVGLIGISLAAGILAGNVATSALRERASRERAVRNRASRRG
ncbi:MAG: threonine/serine exporter family protein [Gemmatimonadaceae bacterium]|nr:threonine/serine exporter family protein [Gemmatimonadaceae bacterium]